MAKKAGRLKFAVGLALNIIGTILYFTPFGAVGAGIQAIGTSIAAVGAFEFVAGALLKEDNGPSTDTRNSASYGFTQWRNPSKGDAVVPVIYSVSGHKHAPVYVAATLSPKGEKSDDLAKSLKAPGQAMSALLVVGEGPIVSIDEIRVNDEPLFEEFTETFKGNGSKKTWTLGKKRVELDTLSIMDGASDRGYTLTDHLLTSITGTGAVVTERIAIKDDIAQEYEPTITLDGVEVDLTSTTNVRPRLWVTADQKAMWIHTQTALPSGVRLKVTVKKRVLSAGVSVRTKDGETKITLASAPATGVKVVVTGQRRIFRGIRVEKRLGGAHQLNLPGFSALRNTYGDGTEILKAGNEVTVTTRDEVDDVVLNVASGSNGFTSFDKEGNRSRTYAQFRVEYRGADANGAYTGTWVTLYDPAGKKSAKNSASGVKKNAGEFEVRGDALSQLFWSFSLINLMKKIAKDFPNVKAHQDRLRDFRRNTYEIRVTRTSSIKGNTNSRYLDDITLSSYEEVIDEFLNYPGTAMLGIHAIASNRLQGSAPQITCKVKGVRDVQKWDGTAWSIDADAQANPVWASIDLITKIRYGGGEQYTLAANIDTASALTAATYCDALETLPDDSTEARNVLSVPLDVRRGLLSTVADMLRPAAIWPVLQGDTWRFVIDQVVTLADVPVFWEDTAARRTTDGQLGHESIAAQPTEIQVSFLDQDKDHDRKEVWVTPGTPATSRRIQRVQSFGATRRTQVTRYANRTYTQATSGGLNLRVKATMKHLGMEAGDVFRYRSNRVGINDYWRVFRITFDSSDYMVKIEAIPYVLAVYGQQEAVQTTDTSSTTRDAEPDIPAIVSRPRIRRNRKGKPIGSGSRRRRMGARARRVA